MLEKPKGTTRVIWYGEGTERPAGAEPQDIFRGPDYLDPNDAQLNALIVKNATAVFDGPDE